MPTFMEEKFQGSVYYSMGTLLDEKDTLHLLVCFWHAFVLLCGYVKPIHADLPPPSTVYHIESLLPCFKQSDERNERRSKMTDEPRCYQSMALCSLNANAFVGEFRYEEDDCGISRVDKSPSQLDGIAVALMF